jgi:hypothetical protein
MRKTNISCSLSYVEFSLNLELKQKDISVKRENYWWVGIRGSREVKGEGKGRESKIEALSDQI